MRSLLFVPSLAFTLLACGGTVTYGDPNNQNDDESEGSDDPDNGSGGEWAGNQGAATFGGSNPGWGGSDPNWGGSDPGWGGGASPPGCDDEFQEPISCTLVPPIVVTPSPLSPTDGCEATYGCDSGTMVVICDGENDGTNTSLCSCYFDGQYVKYGGLVSGEGADACMNGLANCMSPDCFE